MRKLDGTELNGKRIRMVDVSIETFTNHSEFVLVISLLQV